MDKSFPRTTVADVSVSRMIIGTNWILGYNHSSPAADRLIRDHDMIPGLSAHMPELIVYTDENGYDLETYIQLYNCVGFLIQVEVEYIHKVIWNAKKPVMTIKPMAAGRVSPFVGLTFSFSTIRAQDMVAAGCLAPTVTSSPSSGGS